MVRRASPRRPDDQIPPLIAEGFTRAKIDAFVTWLLERGRGEDTASLYKGNLLLCAADPKGLTHRLIGGSLSPNTRRTNLAALSQWAIFCEDAALTKRLSGLRLPPARRVVAKIPLPDQQWKDLIKHLRTCPHPKRCPVMRDIHLIMALRGIRVGDVLRITKADLVGATKTGKLSFVAKGNRRLEYAAKPILAHIESILAHGENHWGTWKTVGDLVNESGKPKGRYHRVRRALLKHAAELEIEGVYPHRLRRTYAVAYLRQLAGDPQAAVKLQRHVGWASVTTALSYTDAIDQTELDAIGDRVAEMFDE